MTIHIRRREFIGTLGGVAAYGLAVATRLSRRRAAVRQRAALRASHPNSSFLFVDTHLPGP
jgi:hypothetical protein